MYLLEISYKGKKEDSIYSSPYLNDVKAEAAGEMKQNKSLIIDVSIFRNGKYIESL